MKTADGIELGAGGHEARRACIAEAREREKRLGKAVDRDELRVFLTDKMRPIALEMARAGLTRMTLTMVGGQVHVEFE